MKETDFRDWDKTIYYVLFVSEHKNNLKESCQELPASFIVAVITRVY